MEWAERIVEVKADLGGAAKPRYRFGSGFIVDGRTVLTAAHVVVDASHVVVRTSDKRELAAVVDPEYVGDPSACDLALVVLEDLELAVGLEPVTVAAVDRRTTSLGFIEGCASVGFPALQDVEEALDEKTQWVRTSKHVGGRIAPLSDLHTGDLALEVDRPQPAWPAEGPLAESPWSGMSGAAVFAGELLVGVVSAHAPRRGPSELTVTPLDALADSARAPVNAAAWWSRLGVRSPGTIVWLSASTPTERPSMHTAPRRVRFELKPADAFFSSRESELASIDAHQRTSRGAVTTVVLTGMGGAGKSQLVRRFARDHSDEFDIIAWIRADDQPVTDLARLADVLRVGDRGSSSGAEEGATEVTRWLSVCDHRWLLVFDDATSVHDIRPWIPASGDGLVLVTSRNRRFDELGSVVAVDVFNEEVSTEYLLSSTKLTDAVDARTLARALGGLPLALAHASAYCREGGSFREYHQQLTDLPAQELFNSDPESAYSGTVATTWKVSVQAAGRRAALAPRILQSAAYLGPDDIPVSLFEPLVRDARGPTGRKELRDGLRALHRYSLAQVRDDRVSIHRLLQKVVRDAQGPSTVEASTAIQLAVDGLERALPADPTIPTWWPQYDALVPHVVAMSETHARLHHAQGIVTILNGVCAYLNEADRAQRAVSIAELAVRLATHARVEARQRMTARTNLMRAYYESGRVGDALADGESLVDDCSRTVGSEDPITLSAKAVLAEAYEFVGRTAEAITLQEQLLARCDAVLGPDHIETLRVRAGLASSYWSDGRLMEALALSERLQLDRESLLGREHPDTLASRTEVAGIYQHVGRIDEAVALSETVLADRERVLGPDHPDTLFARRVVGNTHVSAGRREEAVALFQRLLADTIRVRGRDHHDTLGIRSTIAYVYFQAGDIHKAITLRRELVADYERTMGREHPSTLRALDDLGVSLSTAGDLRAAEALHQRNLTDRARLLGAKHPDTLMSRQNLAVVYGAQGRVAAALELEESVLADREQVLGAQHPLTAIARSNLATTYRAERRYAEALVLAEAALADCERLLGPAHPISLSVAISLAGVYSSAGRLAAAVAVGERVLSERERLLGTHHPDTLSARCALSGDYRITGRTADAIESGERAMDGTAMVLGPDHPSTLNARAQLARAYGSAGRSSDALSLYQSVARERLLSVGIEHRDTLTAFSELAKAFRGVGRFDDAIALHELVAAQSERVLGSHHPSTLAAKANVALAYIHAFRLEEAIELFREVIYDRTRVLGSDHRDTLDSKVFLANALQAARRTPEAVSLLESVVDAYERVLGREHPDTVAARAALATAALFDGNVADAAAALEDLSTEALGREGELGMLLVRSVSYRESGRLDEAVTLGEHLLAECERALDPANTITATARIALAETYRAAGRVVEAISLGEQTLADCDARFGSRHLVTVAARGDLADSYRFAGRIDEGDSLDRRAFEDGQELFSNLRASIQQDSDSPP